MAGGIDWFRWHHGSVNDPKFRLVAKRAEARVSEVLAVWACLLETASAAEDRGNAGAPDFEALDLSLDMADGTASRIYQHLCERGTIDQESGRVVAWEKRQPKRERPEDNSTERVRAHRTKQDHETPCNATQHQETPRGEESREEKITTKSKASPGASRLPPTWTLPKSWAEWVKTEKPDWEEQRIQATAERFRDYWIAKGGKDARKANWEATWRNWIRNERGPPINGGGMTPYQQMQVEKHEQTKKFWREMKGNTDERPSRDPIDITPERVD